MYYFSQRGSAKRQTSRASISGGEKKIVITTTSVDSHINITLQQSTTDLLPEFVKMLGEQEILVGFYPNI